jgi:hypothetical protein
MYSYDSKIITLSDMLVPQESIETINNNNMKNALAQLNDGVRNKGSPRNHSDDCTYARSP